MEKAVTDNYWQKPFKQRRCQARKEPNPSGMWGRCERPRGHEGDHALERGMDAPTWSTEWTNNRRANQRRASAQAAKAHVSLSRRLGREPNPEYLELSKEARF